MKRKKSRRQETRNHNPQPVDPGRVGARLEAAGIDVRIGYDADIVYSEPAGMVRLAHFTYWLTGKQRRLRSVDYFIPSGTELTVPPPQYPINPVVEAKAGIHLTIPREFEWKTDLIRGIAAAHVRDHLGTRYNPKKIPDQKTSVTVVEIVAPSAPTFLLPAKLRDGSKQKGKVSCWYDIEIDLSAGCASAITADGYASPCLACKYCYGRSNRVGASVGYYVDSKRLGRQLEKIRLARQAQGKRTKTICVGMVTDPGHRMYRAELVKLLEFCIRYGIIPVVRSKFLEYDPVVASLLKQADGVLIVSLGSDQLELGAVGQGRTQAARIVDGLRYQRDGVYTVAGVVVDPAQGDGGQQYNAAWKAAFDYFPRVIMYALRAKTKAIAELVFGRGFKKWTDRYGDLMYERHGGEWVVAHVHPDFAQIVGWNRDSWRLCLKSSVGDVCGGCFMDVRSSISTTTTFPIPIETRSSRRQPVHPGKLEQRAATSLSSARRRRSS